jgi:DNA-binding transcriptional ArsR family regulator
MDRDLASIGRILGAPARSAMLNLLMDGSSRPSGELGAYAGVRAAAGSEHLSALLDAGLVVVRVRGRQRFYRLADGDVALMLEHLGLFCPPAEPPTWRRSKEARELAAARVCYDHLAGQLGVAIADGMRSKEWLHEDFRPTDQGETELTAFGLDLKSLRLSHRPLYRACPDWTERRPHVAGALGAALLNLCLANGWVLRKEASRGILLTLPGRRELGAFAPALIRD